MNASYFPWQPAGLLGASEFTGEVLATADPDIVKIALVPGQQLPSWVTATRNDGDIVWGYGATAAAIARGKVVAFTDTVEAVSEDIREAVTSAAGAASFASNHFVAIGVTLGALYLFANLRRR